MNKLKLNYFVCSGVIGLVAGIVVAVFMGVLEVATHFLWDVVPSWIGNPIFYPLLVCGIGGLLVGLVTRKLRQSMPADPTLALPDPAKVPAPATRNQLIGGFLILLFGASVGPEAILAAVMVSVMAVLAKRYPFVETKEAELAEFSIGAMLGIIFAAPLFGISRSAEQSDWRVITASKVRRYVLYLITMFAGFIGYTLTSIIFPNQEQVFAIRRLAPDYTWQGLLLVLPTLGLGILFGLGFSKLQAVAESFNHKIKNPVPLAITGGLILGLAGMVSPYLLFSGEHGVLSFSREAATMELWVVVAIGLGKVLLTMVCLAFNWRGGVIFPLIFSTVAIGLALSQVFHYSPGLILVVFVASAGAVILKQPLATTFLFLLLFPLNLFIWLLLASFAAHFLVQFISQQRPTALKQKRKTRRSTN